MAENDNAALIRRFFAELDRANLAALDQLCADDYRLHFPGVPGPLQREDAKQLFGVFLSAFPGVQHIVEDQIADGDKVAIRLTVRGTHTNEFQGIPPTGKEFIISSINIFRLDDGRIVEQWGVFDTLGLLQQIGAVPAAGSVAG